MTKTTHFEGIHDAAAEVGISGYGNLSDEDQIKFALAFSNMVLAKARREELDAVPVPDKLLKTLSVKAVYAADLTVEEMINLASWCEGQSSDLWDGLSLQEVLNVYRVSAEWINFELWTQDEGDIARRAWNRVVRPDNHLETADR